MFELSQHWREHCPVAHSDLYGGFWVLTRYEDVRAAVQDWKTFSSAHGVGFPLPPDTPRLPPLDSDPPEHRVLRELLNPYFTSRAVAAHVPAIREIVDRRIDAFVERGHCDLATELAEPVPAEVFLSIVLNVDLRELPTLMNWTRTFVTGTDPEAMSAAQQGLASWSQSFLERRRSSGRRGDVVDGLLEGRLDGRPLSMDQMVACVMLLILGGLETMAHGIGNMAVHLARDPELRRRLAETPERHAAAVEEFLRFEAPTAYLKRTVTRDVEIGGKRIAEGDTVLVHWASANRDPSEFERPDELDIERRRNRHLAFGLGVHFCLGAHLARLELRVVLEQMLRRLPDLDIPDGAEVAYKTTFTTRGPISVPVTFTPGARLASA